MINGFPRPSGPTIYIPKKGLSFAGLLPPEPKKATVQVGVEWYYGNGSTALTRLGDAVGVAAPVPAVGTGAGSSPFDQIRPWKGIDVYNIVNGAISAQRGDSAFKLDGTNGDAMVLYPKHWVKYLDNPTTQKRQYWVADGPAPGYSPSIDHLRGGRVLPYTFKGRYATSGTINAQTSKSGVAHLVSQTRGAFRGTDGSTGARAKGTGWSQWDIAAWMAVRLLYLIEIADFNSQSKIGQGYVNGSAQINAGRTDTMVYHTGREAGTDGLTAVQYRWMENLWGNVWQWVDGYNINSAMQYFCSDPANFADGTATNYTQAGYNVSTNHIVYISGLGFDSNYPWLQMPTATSGSATTHVTDYYYYGTGWRCLRVGGGWADTTKAGLCMTDVFRDSAFATNDCCSRLQCLDAA